MLSWDVDAMSHWLGNSLGEPLAASTLLLHICPAPFQPFVSCFTSSFLESVAIVLCRINIYDIYADICLPPSVTAPARQLGLMLSGHPAGLSTGALVKCGCQ